MDGKERLFFIQFFHFQVYAVLLRDQRHLTPEEAKASSQTQYAVYTVHDKIIWSCYVQLDHLSGIQLSARQQRRKRHWNIWLD